MLVPRFKWSPHTVGLTRILRKHFSNHLAVSSATVILELRIYAMYGSARWTFVLCCLLTLAEVTAYCVIFAYPKQGLVCK